MLLYFTKVDILKYLIILTLTVIYIFITCAFYFNLDVNLYSCYLCYEGCDVVLMSPVHFQVEWWSISVFMGR